MEFDYKKIVNMRTKKYYFRSNFFLIFAIFWILGVIGGGLVIAESKGATDIIFGSVFILIDIVLWIIVLFTVKKNLKVKKILQHGELYKGRVVDVVDSGVRVNGFPKYIVQYEWLDENGDKKSDSTPPLFGSIDVEYYHKKKGVYIKVLGEDSVLVSNRFVDSIEMNGEIGESPIIKEMIPEKQKHCDYCGKTISSKDQYCPHCGAMILR